MEELVPPAGKRLHLFGMKQTELRCLIRCMPFHCERTAIGHLFVVPLIRRFERTAFVQHATSVAAYESCGIVNSEINATGSTVR